jgi:hypothetical protein
VTALSVMYRAALLYVSRFGFRVFPIEAGKKTPRARFVRHGHLDATGDPDQIRRWWGVEGDCGIGVAAKASGLVVIDADSYKLDCEFSDLERELGPLPKSSRVLTPQGGTHFYFRDEVGEYVGTAGRGVDVKSQGYVVAPPSIHPNGRPYFWDVGAHILDTPIATLPAKWLQHLTTPRAKASAALATFPKPEPLPIPERTQRDDSYDRRLERARKYLAAMPGAISGSGGHATTFKAACVLVRGFALEPDDALALLVEIHNPICSPPWSERELRHKIKQAYQRSILPFGFLADRPRDGRAA